MFKKFAFVAAALCVLAAGCSVFEKSDKDTATVSYVLSRETAEKLTGKARREGVSRAAFEGQHTIEISLKGDVSQEKSAVIDGETRLVFDEVPVGAHVFAEALVYSVNEAGERELRWKGTSETVTVRPEENEISLVLRRVVPGGEGDEPDAEPEVTDTSIHIFVFAKASGTDGTTGGTGDGTSGTGTGGSTSGTGGTSGDGTDGADVDGTGTETGSTADGSREHPYETLALALADITERNDSEQTYTIEMSGTFTGAQVIADDAAAGTAIPAAGITITGLLGGTGGAAGTSGDGAGTGSGDTGSGAATPEQAVLNGAFNSETNNFGTTLTINTAVPVTLKNLKITGGNQMSEANGGTGMAGGLLVAAGSDVTIGSGTLITLNYATKGAGVYVEEDAVLRLSAGEIKGNYTNDTSSGMGGGVFTMGTMYMYGSAVIGDSSKEETATSSYYANKAYLGAGVYVKEGAFYMGYKSYISETENEPAECSGGIFYNYAGYSGGGIHIRDSQFVLRSGTIGFNMAQGSGAGLVTSGSSSVVTMNGGSLTGNYGVENGGGAYIYSAVFTMNGGTISANKTTDTDKGWGGGLFLQGGSSTMGGVTLFTMNGGTITGNTGIRGCGVGITNEGTMVMTGGTIDGGSGYGIYKSAPLTMSGSAQVNTIYVNSDTIKIAGEFTGTGTVATLSLPTANYTEGAQMLELADGVTDTDVLKGAAKRFAVAQDITFGQCYVAGAGTLAKPNFYVSGTGDDTSDGLSLTNALESVDQACALIIDAEQKDLDWKIYVSGDVTGPHSSTKKAGERTSASNDYGRTIIPETLTTAHAKSLLLVGNTGLDANDMPQDKINRGLDGHGQYGIEEGVNLVVATPVPVTIKNLLLVNGNNAYPNNSSVTYVYTGGGLLVTEKATVTLGDGVVIQDNRAKVGGGVYNAGTLCIHGTALIGDRTKTEAATAYTSSDTCSNSTSGDGGAGIYNTGKLYLGYSDENTPAAWDTEKGGIIYNHAYWNAAGGIYNALSGEVFFNSGLIKYNSSTFTAGAVYNIGTFIMTGGLIENNKTLSGSSASGGGIYNAYINGKGYGTFAFSGGSIKSNSTTGNGGGIYNEGTAYLYGSAVLGDDSAASAASGETNCSNYAGGKGGGIYLIGYGKCYMGYSRFVSPADNTQAAWDGGVYYNYSASNGGGIYSDTNDSNKTGLYINSGKIEKNGVASTGLGGALYLNGNNFSLGGSAEIPPGADNKHDIYLLSSWSSIVLNAPITTTVKPFLTPGEYSRDSRQPLLILADGLTSDDVSIADNASKFTIAVQQKPDLGTEVEWEIREEDGKGYMKTKLEQAQPDNNSITIDIGVATTDLDIRIEGTSSAYNKTGTTYTLLDTSKSFKIYLYNAGNNSNFAWILDDEQISTESSITFGGTGIDISSWSAGTYDLVFECTKTADGLKYSHTIQIKIE